MNEHNNIPTPLSNKQLFDTKNVVTLASINRNREMSKSQGKSTGYVESAYLSLKEDQEDLSAYEQRAGEATISYEELLGDLKSHGKL